MSEIDSIVNVSINRQTRYPSQKNFGIPLVIGQHTAFAGNVKSYASIDEVAEDFDSATAIYKACAALFNQDPSVDVVKVGKKGANVAQEDRITPTAVNTYEYSITVRGTEYTYTSDANATVAEIIAGFVTAMSASVDFVASNETTYLKILASTAGLGLGTVVGDNLALVTQTANVGMESALSTIADEDDNFYGIISASRTAIDVKACAAWTEPRVKIFGTASNDSNILDGAQTDDIAYYLHSKNYDRSFCMYSADQANFPEAAWIGKVFPFDPGSRTWKFKALNGIVADDLSTTQKAAATAKKSNIYTTVSELPITEEGVMASGEYIDIIQSADWLVARIQEDIFATLANEPKIPYTNAGVDSIRARTQAVLNQGVQKNILKADPAPYTTAPDAADVSTANKATRTLADLKFYGEFAGAIHKVSIQGNISV